jgi:hypothetical protein
MTRAFAVVLALDIVGLVVAVVTGLDEVGDAVLVGTPINAPFTFVAVQGLAVLAALRHRAGAVLLAGLCVVSLVSGFADGSYAADGLSAAERALQLTLVAATLVLGTRAAIAASRPRPRPVTVG